MSANEPQFGQDYTIKLGESFYAYAPVNTYHTFRYDFQPASIDHSKRSQVFTSDKQIRLTHCSKDGPEKHVFQGTLSSTAASECLLVFDPREKVFVLEKVASAARNLIHQAGSNKQGPPQKRARMSPPAETRSAEQKQSQSAPISRPARSPNNSQTAAPPISYSGPPHESLSIHGPTSSHSSISQQSTSSQTSLASQPNVKSEMDAIPSIATTGASVGQTRRAEQIPVSGRARISSSSQSKDSGQRASAMSNNSDTSGHHSHTILHQHSGHNKTGPGKSGIPGKPVALDDSESDDSDSSDESSDESGSDEGNFDMFLYQK